MPGISAKNFGYPVSGGKRFAKWDCTPCSGDAGEETLHCLPLDFEGHSGPVLDGRKGCLFRSKAHARTAKRLFGQRY